MPRLIPLDLLHQLQCRPNSLRNVCILAHVDHGKTTLADSLIASNGIISDRMVGVQRYMDSRPDEQQKGITMKCSCISLCYKCGDSPYLINLVDSPGHVDFCGEVAAATRLADGCLILVDVVEGVCPQTHAVLRQAWKEGLTPILVLNKIDRLITQLKMTPLAALNKLQQLVTEVNAIGGELFLSDILTQHGEIDVLDGVHEDLFDEEKEEKLYFDPQRGNVVFSSAIDGWAFQIDDFAKLWAEKLKVKHEILQKTLWGDFYYDPKLKRIRKGAFNKSKKPLFVQMVLENIYAVYETVLNKEGEEKIDKILKSLDVKILGRDKKHYDPRITLKAIMQQWLPLSAAILNSVCRNVPSPCNLDPKRIENMFALEKMDDNLIKKRFLEHIAKGDIEGPTVIFVSKLMAIEKSCLPQNRRNILSQEDVDNMRDISLEKREVQFNGTEIKEFDMYAPVVEQSLENITFLAIARVMCGKITKGQRLFVVGAKDEGEPCDEVTVTNFYTLMGRELDELPESMNAGNIIAIEGIDACICKCATLSSDIQCPPVRSLQLYAQPIVRVSLETMIPCKMPMLITAAKLLDRADPCVRVLTESGELVLVTAGEVHLQRCITDLNDTFSGVDLEISVSEPIIPFLETIVDLANVDQVNEMIEQGGINGNSRQEIAPAKRTVNVVTANKRHEFTLLAVPLPDLINDILRNYDELINVINDRTRGHTIENVPSENISELKNELKEAVKQIWTEKRTDSRTFWANLNLDQAVDLVDNIWSFGPKKARCNLLINCVPDYCRPQIWDTQFDHKNLRELDHGVLSGFQICCSAGPLAEEPIEGVAFIVHKWNKVTNVTSNDVYGPASGQIVATVKEGCKKAFEAQPQRLVAAMYSCVIQATSEVLGKVYAVLSKRRATIVSDEMREGTNLFEISASLPVVESFGFVDDVRKRTSGLAAPQLVFSHWQVVEQDPFWVPSTDEELLHFGEKADAINQANEYLKAIRKRKGLSTDDKIVVHAEKQRTLSKKA